MLAALLTALACALGVLAVIGAGQASLLTLMPLLMLHCFARGVITPNAMHGALEPMGDMAGLAASVVGFLQMAAGALASGAVAALYPRLGPMAMALLMVVCSVAALALSRCGGPRARSQEPKSA